MKYNHIATQYPKLDIMQHRLSCCNQPILCNPIIIPLKLAHNFHVHCKCYEIVFETWRKWSIIIFWFLIFTAVSFHPSDPTSITTGKHAVDFVQESQLLLPSSDSAISRSPGTLPGNNPDCIPVNDVVRMTQHAQRNGKPQAVLPANLGTLML